MLKKESKNVLKQALYFAVMVLLLPVLVLLVTRPFGLSLSYMEAFFFVFHQGLLIFSAFLGISAFSHDVKDGGMEYLLTLPYSRAKLLAYKIIPRFAAVLVCFLVYVLSLSTAGMSPDSIPLIPLLPTVMLGLICLSLFVIGIDFSVYSGSIVIATLGTLAGVFAFWVILSLIYPFSVGLRYGEIHFLGYFFSAIAPVMPWYLYFGFFWILSASVVSLFYAFKTFDLKPSRRFIKKYLKVFVPAVVVMVAAVFLWVYMTEYESYDYYRLTDSHYLLRDDFFSVKIYGDKSVSRIDKYNVLLYYYGIEKDNYIYAPAAPSHSSPFQVIRFNPADPKVDVLYQAEKSISIFSSIFYYKGVIAFTETDKLGSFKNLVFLDINTRNSRKVKLDITDRPGNIHPFIFGAGMSGDKRFWLVYPMWSRTLNIYKVWEEGKTELLGTSELRPYYANETLVTYNNRAVEFGKITDKGLDIVKKVPLSTPWIYYNTRIGHNLEQFPTKEIYCTIGEPMSLRVIKAIRIDLEKYEVTEVKQLENTGGSFSYRYPDTWFYIDGIHFVDNVSSPIKVFRMNAGVPVSIKEFPPIHSGKSGDYHGNRSWISDAGIIIKIDGKLRIYAFPDLNELTFEELN
jgi:hypothetical protein